jgi:hypothetical protein
MAFEFRLRWRYAPAVAYPAVDLVVRYDRGGVAADREVEVGVARGEAGEIRLLRLDGSGEWVVGDGGVEHRLFSDTGRDEVALGARVWPIGIASFWFG